MMEEIELGKCCQIISGSTPSREKPEYWNGDIHWFTPKDLSNLSGKYIDSAPEMITEAGFKSCSTNMLNPNSLLFTSRAPIGHLAINLRPACTNQGFKSLVPNENVDVNYLYYIMMKMTPRLQDLGNGATFKELSKSTLERVKIPLPPLPIQQKIAAILDAADLFRQKTKALIEKYDELAQSLFLEMFGDPVRNEKGWEKKEMGKLVEIRGRVGWKGYQKTDLRDEGPLVLGATHLTNNGLVSLKKPVYISMEKYEESPEIIIEVGDLLIVQRGNTIGKVGLVVESIGKATINPCILILRNQQQLLNSQFLRLLLVNRKVNAQLWKMNNSSAQPMLTQKDIKSFLIINPPISLQNQFAQHIQSIEVQKAQAQKALEKAEDLFNSLLQKAFKGELI